MQKCTPLPLSDHPLRLEETILIFGLSFLYLKFGVIRKFAIRIIGLVYNPKGLSFIQV